MDTRPYDVPYRQPNSILSSTMSDELRFVQENFHQYHCSVFDEEDDQERVLQNEKICKCGKTFIAHQTKEESGLPIITDSSTCFGRKWKSRLSSFKYIQLGKCDREDMVVKYLSKYWRIRDEELVISMVGDEIPLKLTGSFQSKLVQFARDAGAMVLTSGLDEGITKSVNMVFGKLHKSYKQRSVPVIGLSPWKLVKDKHELNYRTDKRIRRNNEKYLEIKTRGNTRLCQGLGYHIFVDVPSKNKKYFEEDRLGDYKESVMLYRHQIEKEIWQLGDIEEDSEEEKKKYLSVPVVIVLSGGNESTLTYIEHAIEEKIPILAVKGTDGLAGFLANSSALSLDELANRFFQYIEVGKEFSKDDKAKILKQLNDLLDKLEDDCFAVCDLDKEGDFDNKILTVLINSCKLHPKPLVRIMRLAVDWNMLKNEKVQELLSRHYNETKADLFLHEALLTAIVTTDDRSEWLEQLLGKELSIVDFNNFISQNLEELYKRASEQYGMTIWEEIAPGYLLREEKSTDETRAICRRPVIARVMKTLFDKYDDDFIETQEKFDQKISEYGESNIRAPLPDKPFNYAFPYKHLLIWAVIFLRPDIAKFAWRMIRLEPLQSAIAMCQLTETLKSRIDDRFRNEKKQLDENKKMFEDLAIQLLSACFVGDENLTQLLLCSPSSIWGGLSVLQMAAGGKVTNFMAAQAVQKYMDDIWNGGIFVNVKRMVLLQLVPVLVATPLMKVRVPYILQRKDGFEETYGRRGGSKFLTRTMQKFYLYFNSPRTKFFHHNLTYFVFLALFVYMVLVDFKTDHVTVLESLCLAWILTLHIDDMYSFWSFPSATWKTTFRDLLGAITVVEFLNVTLFVIGYLVHHFEPHQTFTKIAYSINLVIFQLKIFKAYAIDPTLGPQVVMVKEMTASMMQFLLILLIFIVAYGTSSQALLYTERHPTWQILRDIFYQPYWTVYGEVGLEELEDDTQCVDDPKFCRTQHGLVYIFLGIYILLANVLLLNLLIAIFSNIYNKIYEKTAAIWRYNMYFLTLEYQLKTVFVPPFSILSHIVILLRYIFCSIFCVCCCGHRRTNDDEIVLNDQEYDRVNRMQKEEQKNIFNKEMKETQTSLLKQIQKIVSRLEKIEELIIDDHLDGASASVERQSSLKKLSFRGPSRAVLFSAMTAKEIERLKEKNELDSASNKVSDEEAEEQEFVETNENISTNYDDRKLKRKHRQEKRSRISTSNDMNVSSENALSEEIDRNFLHEKSTPLVVRKEHSSSLLASEDDCRKEDKIHRKKKNQIEPVEVNLNRKDYQYSKKGRKNNEVLESLVDEILGSFQYKDQPDRKKKKKRKTKRTEERVIGNMSRKRQDASNDLSVLGPTNETLNNIDESSEAGAMVSSLLTVDAEQGNSDNGQVNTFTAKHEHRKKDFKRTTFRKSKEQKGTTHVTRDKTFDDDANKETSLTDKYGISPYLSSSDNENKV